MYENKDEPSGSESRFQIEIMLSNGANYDPLAKETRCIRPRKRIHSGDGVSLQALERHLDRYAANRSCPPDINAAYLLGQYSK